ncbi:hypothetical protein HDV00_004344 [Rhizophlyctis rosea]|nr:hypothetical protein HDV00_004344 [Rhizophlyctis rosea]
MSSDFDKICATMRSLVELRLPVGIPEVDIESFSETAMDTLLQHNRSTLTSLTVDFVYFDAHDTGGSPWTRLFQCNNLKRLHLEGANTEANATLPVAAPTFQLQHLALVRCSNHSWRFIRAILNASTTLQSLHFDRTNLRSVYCNRIAVMASLKSLVLEYAVSPGGEVSYPEQYPQLQTLTIFEARNCPSSVLKLPDGPLWRAISQQTPNLRELHLSRPQMTQSDRNVIMEVFRSRPTINVRFSSTSAFNETAVASADPDGTLHLHLEMDGLIRGEGQEVINLSQVADTTGKFIIDGIKAAGIGEVLAGVGGVGRICMAVRLTDGTRVYGMRVSQAFSSEELETGVDVNFTAIEV